MESANPILGLFEKKRKENFTGGIKLGFDQGRPVNCSEYSNPEHEPPPVPEGFNLKASIHKACNNTYYGSLLFILKQGVITHFSSVQTWTGRGIETLFNAKLS